MPRITSNIIMLKDGVLQPFFENIHPVSKQKILSSGYLKYLNEIPEGTNVKVTIEWNNDE